MKKQSKRTTATPTPAAAKKRVTVKRPKKSPAAAPSPTATTRSVTLWLPAAAASGATTVTVAGTFNDWSVIRHPLTRQENGDFSVELELEAGKEYEFRFVIDGVRWENAWNADKYVWSDSAQCENSVIVT